MTYYPVVLGIVISHIHTSCLKQPRISMESLRPLAVCLFDRGQIFPTKLRGKCTIFNSGGAEISLKFAWEFLRQVKCEDIICNPHENQDDNGTSTMNEDGFPIENGGGCSNVMVGFSWV